MVSRELREAIARFGASNMVATILLAPLFLLLVFILGCILGVYALAIGIDARIKRIRA